MDSFSGEFVSALVPISFFSLPLLAFIMYICGMLYERWQNSLAKQIKNDFSGFIKKRFSPCPICHSSYTHILAPKFGALVDVEINASVPLQSELHRDMQTDAPEPNQVSTKFTSPKYSDGRPYRADLAYCDHCGFVAVLPKITK